MEAINKSFWKEYAHLYARITPSFQEELLSFAAEHAKGNVLDAGVGVGKVLPLLEKNKKVKKIIGIDTSKEMLSEAKDLKKQLHLTKVDKLKRMDVNHVKEVEGKIDSIISLNVIYTLNNPLTFLRECFEKLAKNGKLIISSQEREVDLPAIVKQMDEEFDSKDYQKFKDMQNYLTGKSNSSYPRTYAVEEISDILEDIGFEIEEKTGDHYLHSNFTVVATKV